MRSFFFNDTATTEIYTLSLHDALPISHRRPIGSLGDPGRGPPELLRPLVRGDLRRRAGPARRVAGADRRRRPGPRLHPRSEEHTSELQSRQYLVCRLLLEKKKHSSLTF